MILLFLLGIFCASLRCIALADNIGERATFPQQIILGNQVLRDGGYKELLGKRVAVLTNPTGIFIDDMVHIVDAMVADDRVDIVAVFSPEHGFRGDHQAETGDPMFYIDHQTGLPVFSAYNMNSSQIADVMEELHIEAVVVDMQDVGVRLYTFIWTMFDVMVAAASASSAASTSSSTSLHTVTPKEMPVVQIVITDRPNPLGGLLVDGPLLNVDCCSSGYGKLPMPHVHGMTIGELGIFFNSFIGLPATDVVIVKMMNWRREFIWTEKSDSFDSFPPWIPPSPNLPTSTSALAYPATVFLEATTASEGRGTTTPFTLFGAPFVDAEDFSVALNDAFDCPSDAQGFRAAYYQPMWSKYNNTVVPGVQWFLSRTETTQHHRIAPDSATFAFADSRKVLEYGAVAVAVTDTVSPFADGVRILCAFRDYSTPSSAFYWDGSWFGHPGKELIDLYAGTPALRESIDAGKSAAEITAEFAQDAAVFREKRKPYLLYI